MDAEKGFENAGNFINTLPVQPTTFIGRGLELARFCTLLQRPEVRLLTLTGPAGVGKTRLALRMGDELFREFLDGIFFVPLASVSDPQQVIIAILQSLAVQEPGTLPPLRYLQGALREKNLLLILDNFEQVVEAGSAVVELLAACPRLKVLVTSRVVLHVQAEWEIVISPLSVPPALHTWDPDQLLQYEAVALFVARAQAAKADFQLTVATAPIIAVICARLDGLPLAIELAAARIKYFSPAQLLTRLGDALAILAQGAHDLPARQRTLRGAIAWSYQLLSEQEQELFRRLSIFVESWDAEAATAICSAAGPLELSVLEGMLSLVDKSLLWPLQHDEEPLRFRMLQLLRGFGLSCLRAAGEMEVTREAHATYYLALAERSLATRTAAAQKQWHDRLEQEHHNLRAALVWLLEGKSEAALRLCLGLNEFWMRRGYFREARSFFEQALTERAGIARDREARALYQLFLIKTTQDDYQAAEANLSESFVIYEELGDKKGMVACLTGFTRLALIRCDYASVRARVAEIATLSGELGESSNLALALVFSARASILQGEYQEAQRLLEESIQLYQATENPDVLFPQTQLARLHFLANQDLPRALVLAEQCLAGWRGLGEQDHSAALLNLLGQIYLRQGEVARAEEMFEQSLEIVEKTVDRAVKAETLIGQARARLAEKDALSACHLAQQSVALLHEINSRQVLPAALESWGFALAMRGAFIPAIQLWGAALARRERLDIKRPPAEQPAYEYWTTEVRHQLDEKSWTSALAQGRDMPMEDILAIDRAGTREALSSVDKPRQTIGQKEAIEAVSSQATPSLPSGLTARELEVLRLLARGLTNVQIAEQLVISPRTVTTHVTAIYGKIAVSSRSAATRYAIEHGLV